MKLAAFGVKVFRREPEFEAAAYARPFIVRDGEPCGVAAALLVDDGVEKDAFEAEAETQGCAPRGSVKRIALPFVASIAEIVEGMAHQQVLDFGGRASLL